LLIPSLAGVEEFDSSKDIERRRIRQFWSANPNLASHSLAARGSLQFFEEVDQSRERTHWPLYELVPFEQMRGLRVLEVGCGLGSDGARFARNDADYVGLDLTDPAVRLTLQKLRAYGLPGATVQGDAERLPFCDNTFDVAYSWGVIHHTPDTDACVEEMWRVLRPDGRLILMLYFDRGWWYLRLRYHWLLLSLLDKGAVFELAHRVGHVPRWRLQRWVDLYRQNKQELFQQFVARETDTAPGGVNPHSKVYSRTEARRLVRRFDNIHLKAAHWIDLPRLERMLGRARYRMLMRWLGSVNGPCLYVFAEKQAPPASARLAGVGAPR
jgi:ubiquinone/menaquinone biosynthesis C-methylase UbiE